MPADRRYQSHLFQFIWKQSLKLTEQWRKQFRRAKMATRWGLQVTLYPTYLVLQVVRLTGQVARQADAQGQRLMRAVLDPDQDPLLGSKIDTPIQRVLEAIQIAAVDPDNSQDIPVTPTLPVIPEPQFTVSIKALPSQRPQIWVRYKQWLSRWLKRRQHQPLAAKFGLPAPKQAVKIQGIASSLTHRCLVLTTPQNDVLDVLTSQQKQQLQQLMTWEMANYNRQQRLTHQLEQVLKLQQRQLTLPVPRPQMLPPVRGLRQLIAWVQTGPMAASTNLFQETEGTLLSDAFVRERPPTVILALPDRISAAINHLITSGVTQAALKTMDQAIATWESALDPTKNELSEWIQHQLKQRQTKQQQAKVQTGLSLTSQPPTTRLSLDETSHQEANILLSLPTMLRSAIGVLFGLSTTPSALAKTGSGRDTVNLTQPQSRSKNPPPIQPQPWLTWAELYNRRPQPTPSPIQTAFMARQDGVVSVLRDNVDVPDHLADHPMDIPIDAVFMGYEQHPLERILNWLDRIVAWVETWVDKLRQRWLLSLKIYLQQFLAK